MEDFEQTPAQDWSSVLEHVYAHWPAALAEQREWLAERAGRAAGGEHEEVKRSLLVGGITHCTGPWPRTRTCWCWADVGINGGVFRATEAGLRDTYGFKRVIDTHAFRMQIHALMLCQSTAD